MKYNFAFTSVLVFIPQASLAAASESGKKVTRTIAVSSVDPWDFDVHTGAAFGTFKNKDEVTKTFGGFLGGIKLYNESIFDEQTAFLSLDLLIDAESQQIIRKGASIGAAWAFLGGKKRTIERMKVGTAVAQNELALSWINQMNYNSYSITPQAIGIESLEGSNISWSSGFGFHWLIYRDSSLGLSLQQTLFAFSASIEKSTASSTELTLAWRSYL